MMEEALVVEVMIVVWGTMPMLVGMVQEKKHQN